MKIVEHLSFRRSFISKVNDHERIDNAIDKANFQGEFDGVSGRREQLAYDGLKLIKLTVMKKQ